MILMEFDLRGVVKVMSIPWGFVLGYDTRFWQKVG
jgi:hypothetical protein